MGLFHVGCKVVNPENSKSVIIPRLMVDTGAESTWIDSAALTKIGIEPRKKDLHFQMAKGEIITRSVGYAILKVNKISLKPSTKWYSLREAIFNFSAPEPWKV